MTFGALVSSSLVLEEGTGLALAADPQLHVVVKQSGQGSVGGIWEAWRTFLQHMADL